MGSAFRTEQLQLGSIGAQSVTAGLARCEERTDGRRLGRAHGRAQEVLGFLRF